MTTTTPQCRHSAVARTSRPTMLRKAIIGGVTLAAVAFGSIVALAGQASAQTAVIHTTTDVNLRSQPTASSTRVGGVAGGTALTTIDCAAPGQSVNGLNVWMHLTINGATGYFASAYDDSHYSSWQDLLNRYGIPQCGSAPVQVPSTSAQKAIAWTESKKGSTAWDGYCLSLVYQAYLYGAGINVTAGLPYGPAHGSAYTYWTVAPNRHVGDRNPPAGALVFWRSASSPTGPGHVGLSEGGGTIISSYDGRTAGVHRFNINSYQQNLYLGWVKNW